MAALAATATFALGAVAAEPAGSSRPPSAPGCTPVLAGPPAYPALESLYAKAAPLAGPLSRYDARLKRHRAACEIHRISFRHLVRTIQCVGPSGSRDVVEQIHSDLFERSYALMHVLTDEPRRSGLGPWEHLNFDMFRLVNAFRNKELAAGFFGRGAQETETAVQAAYASCLSAGELLAKGERPPQTELVDPDTPRMTLAQAQGWCDRHTEAVARTLERGHELLMVGQADRLPAEVQKKLTALHAGIAPLTREPFDAVTGLWAVTRNALTTLAQKLPKERLDGEFAGFKDADFARLAQDSRRPCEAVAWSLVEP